MPVKVISGDVEFAQAVRRCHVSTIVDTHINENDVGTTRFWMHWSPNERSSPQRLQPLLQLARVLQATCIFQSGGSIHGTFLKWLVGSIDFESPAAGTNCFLKLSRYVTTRGALNHHSS